MKNILFAFFFFITVSSAFSQSLQFGIGSGKLMYSQEPLKVFNRGISQLVPFKTAVTDNFPATFYYQGEAGYNFRKLFIGVNYTFNSTGSRHTLSDYSGSYYYDVVLTGHMPGLSLGFISNINNNVKLYYMSDFGAVFSSLNLKESFELVDISKNEEKFDLETRSYFAKPHLRLSYELYHIKVSLSGGYFIDFESPFHLKGEKEKKLTNYRNEKVTSGWGGFMTGLSVYVIL
jgi:hypothetical protein